MRYRKKLSGYFKRLPHVKRTLTSILRPRSVVDATNKSRYLFDRMGRVNQKEQLHGGGHASRGKYGCDILCQRIFIITMRNTKMFDLDNEGQGHGVQHS